MDRRKVSRGVGRREGRRLGCWGWVGLEVGAGDAGCLGWLPLRRTGADEEDAMGRVRCVEACS